MTKYFSFSTSEIQDELIKSEIVPDVPIFQDNPNSIDFLVMESEGVPRYEMIRGDMDNKIFYNLKGMLEENKLQPISMPVAIEEERGVWNQFTGWIQNFKKSLNTMLTTTQENQKEAGISRLRGNISISGFGHYMSLMSQSKGLLIIPLNRRIYVLSLHFVFNEIKFLEWNATNKDSFALVFGHKVNIVKLSTDNDLMLIKELDLDDVVSLKWSYNGEYCVVLSDGGRTLSIFDSAYKLKFTKTNPIRQFTNVTWAENSRFIVLNTKNDVFILNMFNLSFKSYNQFSGDIIDIIIPQNSLYILIFTKGDQTHHIYILYHLLEDYYNLNMNDSYNNPPQAYTHSQFKVYYKIYCLLNVEHNQIIKIKMNSNSDRLIILTRRKFDDGTTRNVLCVYDINLKKSVHEIWIRLLYNMNTFQEMEIKDFDLHFTKQEGKNFLYTLYEEDKLIARTLLDTSINK